MGFKTRSYPYFDSETRDIVSVTNEKTNNNYSYVEKQRIDVEDFDPLQADLEYSIQSGSLPTGLSIDLNSGEIYGKLPVQAAVTTEYSFTIRAKRTSQSEKYSQHFVSNLYAVILFLFHFFYSLI